MQKAKYIWYEPDDTSRNPYAAFRRTFETDGRVKNAELNIFADTCYQLFVNGKFIGFGPVRFDPKFPQYDTYDIAKYLVPGKNVIAVTVNYFGVKTYKAMPN
ncbi:MAG: alpha-L-rhamnosidase N-terminal domain-containing protein, partial [Defluviitaleaceae bacterium]|nr:alpha-L-rhamnosidase N-terminal domain-containing protein [Defluviitaleaceae bacterium]